MEKLFKEVNKSLLYDHAISRVLSGCIGRFFLVSDMDKKDKQADRRTEDKSVQVQITQKLRWKIVQANRKLVNQALSPLNSNSVYTSSFQVNYSRKSKPSVSGITISLKKIFMDEVTSLPSTSLQIKPFSECSGEV